MWFLVGLGNPGSRYENTRHNVGFLVVDEVARRWGLPSARAQLGALVRRGDVAGHSAILVQPQTFMNCSGEPVGALARFYQAPLDRMIVAHDDLDLDFGVVRLKRDGGHGGHNGLRDLGVHLGLGFLRVRVGISRPPHGLDSVDYVLGRWSDAERAALGDLVARAADAVEAVLAEGAETAMNRFNVRKPAGVVEPPAEPGDREADGGPVGTPGERPGERPASTGPSRPEPGQGADRA
jgi:PTH1 family peptidyl-tRNA hydrolase